jgi:hypothetical protein
MKPTFRWPLLAALLMIFAAPDVMAQVGTDRARDRATEEARRQQAERDRYERDRQQANRNRGQGSQARQQNQRGGQAGGPKFCRTGEGHPRFGMQWCYEKGFATPYGRAGDVIWRRGSLGDIIIGDRRRNNTRQGSLTEQILRDTLGRSATDRARNHGRLLGYDGAVTGRWLDATTLEVLVGGQPVARLVDQNRDGRFDSTMLAHFR